MRKLLIIYLLVPFLFQCQSNIEEEVRDLPETLLVKGSDFKVFFRDFEKFATSLNTTETSLLDSYVKSVELKWGIEKSAERSSDSSSCGCQQGSNTCNASGAFSSCCICCNQRAAVCGSYFGISSCRCEDEEESGDGRLESSYSDVLIYPIELDKFLNYANSNNINVINIRNSFLNLVKNS